jgi:predicted nucleic acid-binding Zn ribbon protein
VSPNPDHQGGDPGDARPGNARPGDAPPGDVPPDDPPRERARAGDARAEERGADEVTHDPTGLALARSIARSTGRPRRRRRSAERRTVDPQTSGAHPDDRDPKPLGAALHRLVESRGWGTEISVHVLLGRWPALVGPELAAHSRPEGYKDTVLTVRTESTAWASQVRLLAPNLVAKLNQQLGDGTVTRVNVLGPDAPSWKKGRLSVRDGRGPRDTYG